MYLAEAKIYGPKGDPDAVPAPKRYTLVPWEEVQEKERESSVPVGLPSMPEMPSGGYNLMSRSVTMRKFSQGDT